MEITVKKTVEARYLEMYVNVRYEEEDIPNDAPFRSGDTWGGIIDLKEKRFIDWPEGKPLKIEYMKVCDEGTYKLFDSKMLPIVERNGYVPNSLLPGDYGDYLSLDIDEKGNITNWLKGANLSNFEEEHV